MPDKIPVTNEATMNELRRTRTEVIAKMRWELEHNHNGYGVSGDWLRLLLETLDKTEAERLSLLDAMEGEFDSANVQIERDQLTAQAAQDAKRIQNLERLAHERWGLLEEDAVERCQLKAQAVQDAEHIASLQRCNVAVLAENTHLRHDYDLRGFALDRARKSQNAARALLLNNDRKAQTDYWNTQANDWERDYCTSDQTRYDNEVARSTERIRELETLVRSRTVELSVEKETQNVMVTVTGITAWNTIIDRCPSCGSHSLFVGAGGYLTCSVIGCKEPSVGRAVVRIQAENARLRAGIDEQAGAERMRLTGELSETKAENARLRDQRDGYRIETHRLNSRITEMLAANTAGVEQRRRIEENSRLTIADIKLNRDRLQAGLTSIAALLPNTYAVDLPLVDRMGMAIKAWHVAVDTICEIDHQRNNLLNEHVRLTDALTAYREVLVRAKGWLKHHGACPDYLDMGGVDGGCNCEVSRRRARIDAALATVPPAERTETRQHAWQCSIIEGGVCDCGKYKAERTEEGE